MITWDNAQSLCQTLSGDNDTTNLATFKTLMNAGYQHVLANLPRPVSERLQTGTTVASQQYYQLPQDFYFMHSITITVGGKAYPLIEEESTERWNIMNLTNNVTSTIPQLYYVRKSQAGVVGSEVGIWPIPSASSNTITISYNAKEKDLLNDAYTTGTVSVTSGSATVTGSGTTFTAAMVGRYFKVDTEPYWYRIASYTGATSIALENVYEGSTGGTLAYTIAEAFNLPDEMQILPVYYAMAHYFEAKQTQAQASKYWGLYNDGLQFGRARHGKKSSIEKVRQNRRFGSFGRPYPTSYPTSLS